LLDSFGFFCVQRPTYDEVLDVTDACRLLLLDWLDSNGHVDLVKTRTLSGDSLLHEAVYNKETVIAVWHAQRFSQLAHTRSTTSGQLPVHVSLERVADQDNCVDSALCQFMIHYSGEGRGSFPWCHDRRTWALEDSKGRTVNDYASSCCVEQLRKRALRCVNEKSYRQMLDMALDEASTIQLFEFHVQRSNLEDSTFSDCYDEIRFFHAFRWVVWTYSSGTNRPFTTTTGIALCSKVPTDILGMGKVGQAISSGFHVFSVRRSILLETAWKSLGHVAERMGLI
jgi:hypothetical protein